MDLNTQQIILDWTVEMFGPIARDTKERASRFIEEAAELSHAVGLPKDVLLMIVERVYSRERGDVTREVGQAALTLFLLAHNLGICTEDQAKIEWYRIRAIPKKEWLRRHAAKVAIGIAG